MFYLIYGLEKFLIDKEIKKIIAEHNIDELNINYYDGNNDMLKDIIDDALTISMWSNKKLIIINNSLFLTGSKNINNDTDILLDYINNPNPDTIIIFGVNNDKLDERKKIVKELKKKSIVKECNKMNNLNNIVKDFFKGYNISNSDLNYFIDRVGNNLDILENEAKKILIYKDDNFDITREDITNLTSKNIDIDIFKLIENIINDNKIEALETYHEMLKYNEEPIKIIIMLANQFRIIYQSKILYQKGYTEANIASNLKIHPYRIKLALQTCRRFKEHTLLKYLSKLADLDYDIKTGKIDSTLGLELFILEI